MKDLSRFGRDYIGVGEYMEQIFPLLGVRLIAINDNYDSNNYKGTTLGMLIGGFVIFMIPQVVGGVVVLLELAAVMLRQVWYI